MNTQYRFVQICSDLGSGGCNKNSQNPIFKIWTPPYVQKLNPARGKWLFQESLPTLSQGLYTGSSKYKELLSELSRKFRGVSYPKLT